MKNETLYQILIAISWLSLHGLKVNKSRIQKYTKLSYVTVSKYVDDVLPSCFLLDNSLHFDKSYKVSPLDKRAKIYKGGQS